MPAPDLTGQRFGRLSVVGSEGSDRHQFATWHCKCECGKAIVALGIHLRSGNTKSCGCLATEVQSRIKHGHSCSRLYPKGMSKEYAAWANMIQRCTNSNRTGWSDYGGRGIQVCDEWLEDFEAFFRHVGLAPSAAHSIDRIDNNGNYEPDNVQWSTQKWQCSNQRPRRPRLVCKRGHDRTAPRALMLGGGCRLCKNLLQNKRGRYDATD
jgi:hypothetical protein